MNALIYSQNEPAENFFTPAEPSTIIAYDTPPQQLLSKLSPKLPPVTQGRTFLPQLDDTIDDSSNDDSLPCITPAKQKSLPSHKPPICRPVDACDEQDVSPNDVKPLPNVSGDDDVPVTIALHSTKKRSRSVDKAPTPKRCRMHDESPAASSAGCSNVNPCDTSIMISTVDANPTTYSELKYLEAVGIMRTIKQPKHRGISATAGGIGAAASIHSSHDPHNDRMTKIKMSYRIRKTDGDVQFALIVYEQVTRNPVTRRNLMAEFNETSMPTPKSNKSVKKRKKPIVIEREPSLRRLRF